MDEPDSLAALQTPDDATRYFTPWGLAGGLLQPEDSVRHLRGSLSRAQLAAQIPDEVRANFARLRKLFLYGLMEYEFFSAASTLTPLVLEGALRVRFLSHYDWHIPTRAKGVAEVLEVRSFDEVRMAAGRRVRLRSSDEDHELPRSLRKLFRWARREGLLIGQRSIIVDGALAQLRDHAAHPVNHHIDSPPGVSRRSAMSPRSSTGFGESIRPEAGCSQCRSRGTRLWSRSRPTARGPS